MHKQHNFLKLIAASNQYSTFSPSQQIDGEMNDKVSIILTIVTMILTCYILLESCCVSYDILKFPLSVYFNHLMAKKLNRSRR